jgi:hypothetical protein
MITLGNFGDEKHIKDIREAESEDGRWIELL